MRSVEPPKRLPQWSQLLAEGIPLRDSGDAPSSAAAESPTIVVFTDLECPFCRRFHEELTEFRKGHDVPVLIVHYPLRIHRFATPAAVAAECASAQGRMKSLVDAVYGKQDSLGLKSWTSYATEAGVADTIQFRECAAAKTLPRIERHLALARALQVGGTPAVVVSGWVFDRPPTRQELSEAIASIRQGRHPVQGTLPPAQGG